MDLFGAELLASDGGKFKAVNNIHKNFTQANLEKALKDIDEKGRQYSVPQLLGALSTGHWIKGLLRGLLTTEAIRTAMRHFGNRPLTGVQVQWGLEHLSLTPASLKEMGAEGLIPPVTLSCRDHEGGGGVKFQQWDGTQWSMLTDWVATDQALVRPMVEASAAMYAQEKGIMPRDCP